MKETNAFYKDIKKIKNEDKLKVLNKMLVNVENKKLFMMTKTFIKQDSREQLKYISEVDEAMEEVEKMNDNINNLIFYPEKLNKLYLSDVIKIEKPVWGENNLIISPVGSGKTTFITEDLVEDIEINYLLLVSTQSLKDSLAPNDNNIRKKYANRMITTKNKNAFGDKKYKITVMTYAEFGNKIYTNNQFIIKNEFKKIFCDEIHSLPSYIKYNSSSNGLIHAQRLLFNKIDGVQVFYFTATKSNIELEENVHKGTLHSVKVFDYSEYPNIMRYIPRATREINSLEQIRQYLIDRKESFIFYKYKGMAFSKNVKSLNAIAEIAREEGFNPLVLWSEHNLKHPLSQEQKDARRKLFETNEIPEPYNFLIFNSALQEGWNLKDNSVKMAIINTTNETDYTQALGRLRRDVDLLVYRTNTSIVIPEEETVEVPSTFINVNLFKEEKEALCKIFNKEGSWTTLKKYLLNSYNIKETSVYKEGKKIRCSVITEK